MRIKVKDIELDLPNDVGVEISEDGKRIVVSQPPTPFQIPMHPIPMYPQPLTEKPYEITWYSPNNYTPNLKITN
jgi:hypothetical protein